jgi:hypothetical protein
VLAEARRRERPLRGVLTTLLAIYLNDHLAGATAGVELARRLRASNRDDPAFGPPLAELCAEVEADRETLKQTMERLGIRRGCVKPAAAWAGEKLGRLKLNGRLRGYSPLSRLLELELLAIGIAGKARMWRALEATVGASLDGIELAHFAERADRQRGRVEELHRIAAIRAFASVHGPAASG